LLFHALLIALSPTLLAPQEGRPRAASAPPGTVWIEGAPARIGSTEKEITALAELDEMLFVPTACETPQHEVRVDGFYLGVGEVTNEQYQAFVKAAAHRAPSTWGGSEAPKGSETLPVVGVDYDDAESYASWAGLRLMTEVEYQRAGRGKDARIYPWGDAFDPDRALTNAAKATAPKPIGSYPEGATSEGVQDLCGNVWEWTSSPFTAYPRWKALELDLGKAKGGKKLEGQVAWNEEQRVVVGGSFQNDGVAARLTTRRGTDRAQSTDSLGLRVAASAVVGLDRAEWMLRREVLPDLRPSGVAYDVAKLTATDRWRSQPGSSKVAGYGMIEGYDFALFVPVVDLPVASQAELDALSTQAGPVAVGILSLSLDASAPALPHGTYFVAYLAKGAKAENDELPASIDRAQNNLVFYSLQDQATAALPLGTLELGRPKDPRVNVAGDKLTLGVTTWLKAAGKGLGYEIPLGFKSGTLGNGWRH